MRVLQPSLLDLTPPETPESFLELCRLLGADPGPVWPGRFGAASNVWAKSISKNSIRTLSLFSGVGGLDIAFHDAGFQIEAAVEIDPRFAATLRANSVKGGYLEGTEILCQDVREFHPPASEQIDFIRPPCQCFSAAGRRPLPRASG